MNLLNIKFCTVAMESTYFRQCIQGVNMLHTGCICVAYRAATIQIQIQIFSRFEGFKDNYLHLYSYIKKIHFKINLLNLIQRYKHLKINLNDLIKWQIHLKTDLHNLIQQENFGLQTCCFTKIIHLRYYVFGYFS